MVYGLFYSIITIVEFGGSVYTAKKKTVFNSYKEPDEQ
jgi:hypothetical protein